VNGIAPALVAAGSAGLAVALLTPARAIRGLPALSAPRPSRWWVWRLMAVAVAALLVLGLPAWPGVPVGIAGCALAVLWSLWTRRRSRVRRRALEGVLLETCQQLASELCSGQPPGAALDHAARLWPALAPTAEAFRVGADVPDALRDTAARLDVSDMRLLAAAWQMAQRTGQGLAASVERVVEQLLNARAIRRVVDGELASARATARLVAALPVVALAMGSGTGADPLAFLLSTPAGWLCLGAGLALAVGGLWWIEAIAADVERAG
jgi:tight adherence protein B